MPDNNEVFSRKEKWYCENHGWQLPGWYFWDEAGLELEGPFSTYEEVTQAFEAYYQTL